MFPSSSAALPCDRLAFFFLVIFPGADLTSGGRRALQTSEIDSSPVVLAFGEGWCTFSSVFNVGFFLSGEI